MANKTIIIDKFYGGVNRDDKPSVLGVASNMEELDIWGNGGFFQAEQIMSSDTLPASSELYSITGRDDTTDTVYGYGKETSGNKIRLFQVTTGGDDNPGAWATLFTSADATDIADTRSPISFHKTSEAQTDYLYYLSNASGTWKLRRYNITADSEAEIGTLSGLGTSFPRPQFKRFFGRLWVLHGQFIAKVDTDGTYTEKAFTLPNGMVAIDLIPVGSLGLILARPENQKINETVGYWWDFKFTSQVEDEFHIPMGGGQWVANYREKIIILCAHNGISKVFQMSGNFRGSIPVELPGLTLEDVKTETSAQPISPAHAKGEKDGILYFTLWKTDKSGIYALGQLDETKPIGVILSKRFDTSDYSLHTPYGLHIQGPNFYSAFSDNGTADASRCETNNSPARSSNAVYESIWLDFNNPHQKKDLLQTWISTYPLPASTAVALSVDSDYSGSYTAVNEEGGGSYNTQSATRGRFIPKSFAKKYVYRTKLALTSNSTDSPKVAAIGVKVNEHDED